MKSEPIIAADSCESNTDLELARDVRSFVSWSFAIFVVALPLIGYLLGGAVISLIFVFLGIVIFALLEQLSH